MKKTEGTQPETANTVQPNKKELKTVREHADRAKLLEEIYAGLKARMGWKDGKEVSWEEFEKSVKDFLDAPADGREVKTNGRR